MIVIVDGPDRTGKTTLCTMLTLPPYNLRLYKGNAGIIKLPDSIDRRSYVMGSMRCTVNMLRALKPDIVFDRLHLSEFVYGKLLRKYDDASFFREIDDALHELGAKVVLLSAEPDGIAERSGKDKYMVRDELDLFDRSANDSKLPVYKYDIQKPVKELADWLMAR